MSAASDSKGSEMSFWDHLDELRGTLIHSIVYVCAFSALGLIFKSLLFENIILAPTEPGFCVYRLLGWDFSMDLINVDLSAQFFVHLKASFAAGFILAFPFVVWELWKFIAPALYEREKVAMRTAFLMSGGLFYLGVLVGYFFVLPVCLQFFMNYSVSDAVQNSITLGSYMSMFMSMVLLIGLVFEFPTVVLVLGKLGVVSRGMLRGGRKYALVVILVLAALITPSDPFSMFVLAVPMYLLYEASILICPKGDGGTAPEEPSGTSSVGTK